MNKKHKYFFKRLIACVCAVSAICTGLLPAVFAANNTLYNDQPVQLSYDGTTALNVAVIRGVPVLINATNVENRAPLTNPLKIVKNFESGDQREDHTEYFHVSGDKSHMSLRAYLKSELAEDQKPYAAESNYTISSNYGTMKWKADFVSQTGGTGLAEGAMTLVDDSGRNGLNILTDSYVKLIYNDGVFTLDPSTATGIFRDFESIITYNESEHIQGSASVNEQFTLYMREKQVTTGASGGTQYIQRIFTFEPRQVWKDPDTDENRYDIQNGSVYEIRYQFKTSYPLTLTVLDPEKVLTEIVTQATSTDLRNNEYVTPLENGNTNNYITGNLTLASTKVAYDQEVQLSWEWIPDGDNPTEAEKNAVNIVTHATKPSTAEITRLDNDISGVLRVKALFSSSTLNSDVTNGYVIEDLPITIHGRGTAPEISTITGYVGHGVNPDTTTEIKTAGQNLPSSVTMDAYRNDVDGYTETTLPYSTEYFVTLGQENGRARQIYIDLLNADGSVYTGDAVTATLTTGKGTADYKFGTAYNNTGANEVSNATLKIYANGKAESLRLRFRFFVAGPSGDREETDARKEIQLIINDTTPDRTAALTNVVIKSNNLPLDNFTFNTDTSDYEIDLPYTTDNVLLIPTKYKNSHDIIGLKVEYQDAGGLWQEAGPTQGWESKDTFSQNKEWVFSWADQEAEKGYSIRSGASLALLPKVEYPLRVSFTVRAQYPSELRTYTFTFRREAPSDNSFLKTIKFLDENGKNLFTQTLTRDVKEYNIEVPFKTRYLQVLPETEHSGAFINSTDYSPMLVKRDGMVLDAENWWKLTRPTAENSVPENKLTIRVHPQNEVEDNESLYTFNLTFKEPSTDSTLSSLTITDGENKRLTYTPNFHKDMAEGDYYSVTVPFTTDRVNISAVPSFSEATHQLLISDLTTGEAVYSDMSRTNPSLVMLPIIHDENQYYTATVIVTAEDLSTQTEYPIRIYRTPPSDDATLSSLVIKDQDGTDISGYTDYAFNTDKTVYTVSVPFETEKVTFTPTSTFGNVTAIKVNDLTVINTRESQPYVLNDALTETEFTVKITPENVDAPDKEYTVIITRRAPSSDARLKSLSVEGAENFKPIFLADTLEYTADISQGQPGVTITATSNEPHATITVRGTNAPNGAPTDLIELLEVSEEIHIVVTAQDGITQRDYVLTLTDLNKIELSSNADLKSLTVTPGVISPQVFEPSVTTYDVAVSEDTASVKIIPEPADPAATIQVFNGSKQIGDENDNYADYIVDGQNEFIVKVTAPDNSKTKEYTINVYRNDDDNSGLLKPITADDIDFEVANPIIVDITKYTRVAADVFNTLKNEYPDKTIIFEGNDYSLTFKASDIINNVPITTIYDFALSFTTPEADNINPLLTAYAENALLDKIYVYFRYHGDLPAPAVLNISVGHRYANLTLYWHYFNTERNRIDYYGSVIANSRGNFSVLLTHCSTYIVSTGILYGSEDLSGSVNINANSSGKTNPNTAAATVQNTADIGINADGRAYPVQNAAIFENAALKPVCSGKAFGKKKLR